jgi:hypothetical protein
LKRVLLALAVVLLVLPIPGLSAGSDAEAGKDIVLEFNPAEIHQQMWDDLKPRLAQRQVLEVMAAAKTATNWQEYDMDYYKIDLAIDHITEIVGGRVDTYGSVVVSSLDSVMVNLLSSMTVDSVYSLSGNLSFNHADDHLTVYLDAQYLTGEQFYFTVVYHGHPSSSSGFLGMEFSQRGGLPLITTLSEPMGARSWWPCNDISKDKIDSVDIIVTVDTSLVVSSNGLIESEVDNGNGTHTTHWKSRYPIAPYLVSLGIHPYAVWYDYYNYGPSDSMPLHFYVYPDHNMYSRTFFDGIIVHMIENLTIPFGTYPFIEEKYGCTHFDWGGAMEHQTNTSTTSSSFGYSQPVVSHELGHQWWGDMVTCDDWHHIWINEGFAVYSEALYFEADSGTDYYHAYMNSFEYTGGGSIYIDDTTSVWNIFSSRVYDKGGWVLHMLRHVVGDNIFFEALAHYRDQYIWKSATTEDFQGAVEDVAKEDLDWFFQEWIYGTYRPNYRYSYIFEEDPGGWWNTYLHIRQTQNTDPNAFTMPIDMKITTTVGSETQVVFNDEREQNFILHTDDEPLSVNFDIDRWISRSVLWEEYGFHIFTDQLEDGALAEAYEDTVIAKGPTDNYLYEIMSGAMPGGLALEPANGIISGIPSETGDFSFMVRATHQTWTYMKDSAEYFVQINPPSADRPGDANSDGAVDVGDAVYLINYIFRSGSEPLIGNWADANADCEVNVGDATYLISFVFKNGAYPQLGCVE